MPTGLRSPLVAIDANVLIDLGQEVETIIDALTTIRRRVPSSRLVIPPTPQQELAHIARYGQMEQERSLAMAAIRAASVWKITPVNLMPVDRGIVSTIAERLRTTGLLPMEEVNDSFLLVEAALLHARLLLSSDEHLRSIPFEDLAVQLQNVDLIPPVIATPAEVARKFFPR
jgi:hypothetical protein